MIASSKSLLIVIGILVVAPVVSFSQTSNYIKTNDGVKTISLRESNMKIVE